jgi:diguanylate cyclase
MLSRIRSWISAPVTRGNGVLFFACLLSLAVGLTEVGEPVENMLRHGRDQLRPLKASGDIVVVGIDSRSLKAVNKWPWPRAYHAKMIDKLNEAGAKKILFDFGFFDHSDNVNDQKLENSIKNANGKVYLATRFFIDERTHVRSDEIPLDKFLKQANGININWWIDAFGVPRGFPYRINVSGKYYPSMAAEISNLKKDSDVFFRADYAIDVASIPRISAIDLINGKISRERIFGKNIIIASSSADIGDIYQMPGYGILSGVYFWVLAAETLKRGEPVEFGWLYPWVMSIIVTCCFMSMRQKWLRRSIYGVGVLGALVLPVVLDQSLIFVQVVPAFVALGIVGIARTRANFKKRLHDSGITNSVTGLYNLNALREVADEIGDTLIAVKVHNFVAMKATFPPEREKELVDQIIARLDLNTNGADLYQGDDGVFVWLARPADKDTLTGQLEALYALFRSPVRVGEQSVNLFVTFGLDSNDSRSLSNRVNAALLAADEAAKSGQRWSETGVDKSRDTESKLLLLGRLDEAISNGEIWVAYQPKLDLATRRICGAEALVRWSHPERGEISPEEFVVLAEEQNRIDNLTTHVLEAAIKTAAAVNQHGVEFEIAVNLSPRAFDGQAIDAIVGAILAQHELDARFLTLEITETAVMRPDGAFLDMLNRLSAIGVNISIDDFGTGQSTLAYLKSIPGDEVKIDRSLIADIEQSDKGRNMVNSTINLIHSLGRKAVAEGIESEAMLVALTEMGCDKAQGYFVGRPMRFRDLWRVVGIEPRQAAA